MADNNNEILARSRRIETRVTEIALVLGVGQGAQKPTFEQSPHGKSAARVYLPSLHASMASILEAVPDGWYGQVYVFFGETHVCTITR